MTKKDIQLAIAAVNKYADIKALYIRDGHHCIIGGMALEAGVPLAHIQAVNNVQIHSAKNELIMEVSVFLQEMRWKIYGKYGLECQHLHYLQDINDSHDDVDMRRKCLISYLEGLVTDPEEPEEPVMQQEQQKQEDNHYEFATAQ